VCCTHLNEQNVRVDTHALNTNTFQVTGYLPSVYGGHLHLGIWASTESVQHI
jgi:hypothetical protein